MNIKNYNKNNNIYNTNQNIFDINILNYNKNHNIWNTNNNIFYECFELYFFNVKTMIFFLQ